MRGKLTNKTRSSTGAATIVLITLSVVGSASIITNTRSSVVPSTQSRQFLKSVPTPSQLADTAKQEAALLLSLHAAHKRPQPTVAEVLEKVPGFQFERPAGQVGPETPYGKVLYDLSTLPDVRVAIETGTWDGSGSSMALGMGFKDSEGMLFTIEAVEEKWIHAEHNLAQYPVKCLLGVGVDSSELPTVDKVLQEGGVGSASEETWTGWLAGEKALSDSYPVGLLKPICERYKVDLVHIDGGEFAGPAEFKSVQKHCKHVHYIALDDTLMYKNKANYRYLASDPEWEVVKEDKDSRFGWAVFRRRNDRG